MLKAHRPNVIEQLTDFATGVGDVLISNLARLAALSDERRYPHHEARQEDDQNSVTSQLRAGSRVSMKPARILSAELMGATVPARHECRKPA